MQVQRYFFFLLKKNIYITQNMLRKNIDLDTNEKKKLFLLLIILNLIKN